MIIEIVIAHRKIRMIAKRKKQKKSKIFLSAPWFNELPSVKYYILKAF